VVAGNRAEIEIAVATGARAGQLRHVAPKLRLQF